MFKQILFTLLLLVVSRLYVSAQSRGVSGRVVEKSSGTGIAMANVIVKDQNEKVITFATTDSIGAFALSVGDASGMTVSVSVLGYKTILHRSRIQPNRLSLLWKTVRYSSRK